MYPLLLCQLTQNIKDFLAKIFHIMFCFSLFMLLFCIAASVEIRIWIIQSSNISIFYLTFHFRQLSKNYTTICSIFVYYIIFWNQVTLFYLNLFWVSLEIRKILGILARFSPKHIISPFLISIIVNIILRIISI